MYMADLLVIGGKLPVNSIPGWSQIVTPMSAEVWGRQLASHPDESFQEYLVEGLRRGFRIGFSHDSVIVWWLSEITVFWRTKGSNFA